MKKFKSYYFLIGAAICLLISTFVSDEGLLFSFLAALFYLLIIGFFVHRYVTKHRNKKLLQKQRIENEILERDRIEAERLHNEQIRQRERNKLLEEIKTKKKFSTYVAGVSFRQDEISKFVTTVSSKKGLPKYDNLTAQEIKYLGVEVFEYTPLSEFDIELIHEPTNQYDSEAIKVLGSFADSKKFMLGYIPKDNIKKVNEWLSEGRSYYAEIEGGKYKEVETNFDTDREYIANRQKNYFITIYFNPTR